MKKLLPAVALAMLTFGVQSCKKDQNQPADQLVAQQDVQDNHDGHDHATEAAAPVATENGDAESVKTAQSKPLTNLVLSEDMFNFGDIKKGQHKEHKYEVTNTGKNPLIISEVKPGCGCTVPDYTKTPILPGQKGFITLNFDSTNFDGAIHKQAQVFANVETAPLTIGFTGNVVP